MNTIFWALMVIMLLLAIGLLVYPLLKVRTRDSLAYKESNLKINEDKIKELDADLAEGRIDQQFYRAARDELDKELLVDIPGESQDTAALHYTATARRHPAVALMISVFLPATVMLVYLQLGMHAAGDDPVTLGQQQADQQQINKQEQELASVEKMAAELEAKLIDEGGTSKDWVLLGRAHKYMGRNELAAKAFAVALESDTENAQLMLEAAEVTALNNGRVFTAEAVEMVRKAYSLEPDNANVLWFIGVVEYQQKNYRQAIDHLKKLLPLAGDEEDVLKSIVAVVAKSRTALIEAGEEMPELEQLLGVPAMTEAVAPEPVSAQSDSIRVSISSGSQASDLFDENATVFVYAKALKGPKMPLAVQRLRLADLPATVVLDDSMAMMQGMQMSAFEQLEISARISRTGSAMAESGDYIGRQEITDKSKQAEISIVIDTVVP
jgi:cytochrome c-type biogenesis protein CcmH